MSDPAFGQLSKVVVDYESGWNTAKGVPAGFRIAVEQSTLSPAQALIANTSIRGDFNTSDPAFDKKSASGNIVMNVDATSFPWFTKMFCGNLTEADWTGTAYSGASSGYSGISGVDSESHTSLISTDVPLSGIIETSYNIPAGTKYSKAVGCRISKFSFPIDPTGFLKATYEFMAADVVTGDVAYNATPTDWTGGTPLDHLTLASTAVKIGGNPVAYIAKGTFNLDCGLDGNDYRVGAGGTRGSLVPTTYKLTGTLTLVLDSAAVLSLVSAGTPTSLEFTWETDANDYIKVLVPRVFISKSGPTLKGPGPVQFDCNWTAAYDTSTASMLMITTANKTHNSVYV